MTRVVNIKSGDPYDVYIGRANGYYKLKASSWKNPFRVGTDGSLDQVLEKYYRYMINRHELATKIHELQGLTLSCWCRPDGGFKGRLLCHGQILSNLADGFEWNNTERW